MSLRLLRQHTSACVSIRQHASAYVGMRQLTSAYVSIRRLEDTLRLRFVHMCVRILPYMLLILCCICLEPAATPLSMSRSRPTLCQHTSACVSIRLLRQHTSACRLQDTPRLRLLHYCITYYITMTDHCVSVWCKDKLKNKFIFLTKKKFPPLLPLVQVHLQQSWVSICTLVQASKQVRLYL
jgi:hypothetical protein